MARSIQILSTKKLSGEQKQALVNANFEVVDTDFIQTQNKSFELKDLNDNLIFTSQNAVHSVLSDPKSEQLKSKNVFCVGLKTKIL